MPTAVRTVVFAPDPLDDDAAGVGRGRDAERERALLERDRWLLDREPPDREPPDREPPEREPPDREPLADDRARLDEDRAPLDEVLRLFEDELLERARDDEPFFEERVLA